MGVPTPATSPWVQEFGDYVGLVVRITVTFNETTRLLSGITVFRDAGCQYNKILIGTGADGDPDDTDKVVNVPVGTRSLNATQMVNLANRGLGTIEDITALSITAGR